jgi:hypothetical protein
MGPVPHVPIRPGGRPQHVGGTPGSSSVGTAADGRRRAATAAPTRVRAADTAQMLRWNGTVLLADGAELNSEAWERRWRRRGGPEPARDGDEHPTTILARNTRGAASGRRLQDTRRGGRLLRPGVVLGRRRGRGDGRRRAGLCRYPVPHGDAGHGPHGKGHAGVRPRTAMARR